MRLRHCKKGEVIGLKDNFYDSFMNVAIESFQLDFFGWMGEKKKKPGMCIAFFLFFIHIVRYFFKNMWQKMK